MYSIGDPENPTSADESFETVEAAEIAAIEKSFDDHIWCVWENKSGEVLSLIFQQQVFTA